jgi:DNA polymerase-1
VADAPVLYLLDASSYIHRAFHAIRGLSTSEGVPTGAVYGFTTMLLKVLREARPRFLAVVYDAKGPTFRHEIYPAYKANRPPLDPGLAVQMPLVRQVVTAFGLPAVEAEGYEADDLMATLARQATGAGYAVVLVSADKDLFQLVGPSVQMWDTMKEARLGPEEVAAKLGVEPGQVVDYMALTGDSSDNVPGVPGVGPKSAAKLIAAHGDLEGVLAAAEGMKKSKMRQNLLDHADQARLSRRLVALAADAPASFEPEAFEVAEPEPAVLAPVLAKLEFSKLLAEMAGPSPAPEADYACLAEAAGLEELCRRAREAGEVAVDTETTSLDAMSAELVGVSLCLEPERAVYVPVGHTRLQKGESQLSWESARGVLGPLLADPAVRKIGQNLKYDLTVLQRAGAPVAGPCFDTMVASYLLNPGRASHGLAAIAGEFLGRSVIPYEEAVGGKNKGFAEAPLAKAVTYAAEDADVALQAARKMEPLLAEAGLAELFAELEMPLVPVLAKMERNGVALDTEGLASLAAELTTRLDELQARCYRLAGHEFNLNSPSQLGKVLFEELGLAQRKKTKSGAAYSTDMSVLTALAEEHPLPAEVLAYRTLAKLLGTYVEALPGLVNPETGRVHTSFNQAVTATGRLSSSEPNLQNIPVRSELGERIRSCFVAGPGMVLVSADYSQVELRVLAHLSADALLMDDLTQGRDVHTQTASRLFEVDPGEVTADQRRRAKTVNFGVLYGMSAYRLAREQKIEVAEAQEIISRYLGRYQGVAAFQEENLARARELGYVTTLLGRRRFLPGINYRDRATRQAAERVALNTPIQGTAADIIKLAMLAMDRVIAEEHPRSLMTLQVHDELVFETPAEEAAAFCARVKQVMEGVVELRVPLVVEAAWGDNWAQAH